MKSYRDLTNYYLHLAKFTANLSYAPDKKVGAVLVCQNESIFTSYNGTLPFADNCTVDPSGKTLDSVIHAEQGVLTKASRAGVSTIGATIYCTLSPCIHCAKLLLMAGVNRLYYIEPFKDLSGLELFQSQGFSTKQIYVP